MTDEVLSVHIGRHRLHFATPDDVSALYPEAALEPRRRLPAMVALMLRVRDTAAAVDHLTRWHVAHDELADGRILVPPEVATGALLVFQKG
jgi:hypothetical protein